MPRQMIPIQTQPTDGSRLAYVVCRQIEEDFKTIFATYQLADAEEMIMAFVQADEYEWWIDMLHNWSISMEVVNRVINNHPYNNNYVIKTIHFR